MLIFEQIFKAIFESRYGLIVCLEMYDLKVVIVK